MAVLTSTHNLCFEQKYEKYLSFLSENFQFLEMKCSIYLHRHVFVMRPRRGWTRDLLVTSRTAHPTEPPRPALHSCYNRHAKKVVLQKAPIKKASAFRSNICIYCSVLVTRLKELFLYFYFQSRMTTRLSNSMNRIMALQWRVKK